MRHTISVLVDNKPGVLARVAGLFSGRGFNTECLAVNETLDRTVSQMTLVTRGDDQLIEQIMKQLNKLIDVIKVVDLETGDYVGREMVLIKVNVDDTRRSEVLSIIDIFRGKVVDISPSIILLRLPGMRIRSRRLLNYSGPLA